MYTRKDSYDTAWLKAERDLATSKVSLSVPCSPDDIPLLEEEKQDKEEKSLKHIRQSSNPSKLESYQPGATRLEVFSALKKTAKIHKKHGKQPVLASS
jgi:hypothetical protein